MSAVSATSPLAVAVVGFGYWGPNLARNVAAGDATTLHTVCDLDADSRARAAASHPATRVTDDWASVLADEAVDAVVVALPIALHHQFALEALRSGKHVLVEKPLARTVAECDELITAADAAGVQLMVGHTFEYNAAVKAVKDYLDGRELGEPYYIAMRRLNLGIVRSDANAMWSLAPHDVSILCHWLGRNPLTVSATGAARLQKDIHDVVFISVGFDDGVVGHIHCSWLEPEKVREATIVGSRKMVRYDDVSATEKIRLYDKGIEPDLPGGHNEIGPYDTWEGFQLRTRAGDVETPELQFEEPLKLEVAAFAEAIRTGTPAPTDGHNGRRVVAILEAAQRSLEDGGAVQSLDHLGSR